jgi:hypothetical protein
MSDQDRAPNPQSERAPVRERRRTTIVDAGERGGGGGGGAIALILLLIVVAGLAWFLMRSGAPRTAANVGVNVSLPKDVNLKVPDMAVKSDRSSANYSH